MCTFVLEVLQIPTKQILLKIQMKLIVFKSLAFTIFYNIIEIIIINSLTSLVQEYFKWNH